MAKVNGVDARFALDSGAFYSMSSPGRRQRKSRTRGRRRPCNGAFKYRCGRIQGSRDYSL